MATTVEIRDGCDWVEVWMDGELISADHSFTQASFSKILKKLGIIVTEPMGDFCEGCENWIPGAPICEGILCKDCDSRENNL